MKRFQNISPVTTSVMKKSSLGEFKAVTVRPGQIVHLTTGDIEYTRDSYNPSENSPLESGWIVAIPAGMAAHPDLPDFGRNPNIKSAAEAFQKGLEETGKMIDRIKDQRGLVMVRRALESEKAGLGEVMSRKISELVDRQSGVVQELHSENEIKYRLKG